MSSDVHNLECQVGQMLAELAPSLEVQPPPRLLEQVGWAVHDELNELWLTEQSLQPVVPPEALERARQRVRRDLSEIAAGARAKSGKTARWPRRPLDPSSAPARVWSTIAAAAMIGICVGLIRFGGLLLPLNGASGGVSAVDLFVQAGEAVQKDDGLGRLSEDLSSIEEGVAQWRPDRDRLEDRLEDIGDDIEDLFSEPEPPGSTS